MELGRVEAGVAGRTQVGRDADDVVEVVECRAGRGELPRGWQLLVLWLLLRLLPWLLLWLLLAVNRRPQVNCAYASRRCNAAAGDLGEGGVNDLVAVSLHTPLGGLLWLLLRWQVLWRLLQLLLVLWLLLWLVLALLPVLWLWMWLLLRQLLRLLPWLLWLLL